MIVIFYDSMSKNVSSTQCSCVLWEKINKNSTSENNTIMFSLKDPITEFHYCRNAEL